MTMAEMAHAIGVIQELWPTFLNGRDIIRTTEIWGKLFQNDTPSELETAVYAYACRDTKGFPPPIGALKELVWQQRNKYISEQTAWELVKTQFSGSSAHPRENFEKLPQIIQQCVGSPSTLMKWGQMNENELEAVIGSTFKRNYRDAVIKQREYEVLPDVLKPRFAEIQLALPSTKQEAERLETPPGHEGRPCPPKVRAKIFAACGRAEEDTNGAVCN